MKGYAGKVLVVDLTDQTYEIQDLNPSWARDFLGGTSLGARYLYDLMPPHTDPFAPESAVQGTLQALYELQELLKKVTGLAQFTLQPAAGAHGELTGILTARRYNDAHGNKERCEVIVPDDTIREATIPYIQPLIEDWDLIQSMA